MRQVHRWRDTAVHSVQVEGGSGIEVTVDLAIQRRELADLERDGLDGNVRGRANIKHETPCLDD
jgi:hypothetical protein